MVRRTKSYGINNPLQDVIPNPVIAQRAPKTTDTNYEIGQTWVDKTTNQFYGLGSVVNGVATWSIFSPGSSDVDTLTGDTGGPLSPSGGNINILGGDGLTVDGSGSTLTINRDMEGGYPITPFVVGNAGEAGYTTIQGGLDAANAAGGGTVYIQPGTYVENLTFYDNVYVVNSAYLGVTSVSSPVVVQGTHTPPLTGNMSISGLRFESATDVFNSAAAGSCQISIRATVMAVTNGYTFNLPNWTGRINCNDCGSNGTDDGFLNNPSGGLFLFTNNGQYGAGSGNTLVSNGDTRFDLSLINCPVNITGGTIFYNSVLFTQSVTFGGASFGSVLNGNFANQSGPALTFNTTGDVLIGNTIINTPNNPAIDGTGTGDLILNGIQFLDGDQVGGTLPNLGAGNISGGNFISQFVVGEAPSAQYQTIQSAIDAATAASGGTKVVWVKPGSYTEDLNITSDIIFKSSGEVTLTGEHTPPASGTLTFDGFTLVSATNVLNSAAAGSTTININNGFVIVTNGYLFNLPNWTGELLMDNCGSGGTDDGVINNASGSSNVKLINVEIGAGSGNTMELNGGGGFLRFDTCNVNCPVNMVGSGEVLLQNGVRFGENVTIGGSLTGYAIETCWRTGTSEALTFNSSGNFSISSCEIQSTNSPAIGGTGAGTLTLSGISFPDNAEIAGTLTLDQGENRGGNVISRFVVGESPDAKYQTIQSAIDAASAIGSAATVVIQPGSYTENLTLADTIDLVGNIADGVTITGTHTPPASGRISLQNLTLVSATDVLNSAAAGTTDISILDCEVAVTNGYLANLANWTGEILINDCMGSGTNDGVINNTGGASIILKNSDIGVGATNTLTFSGGSSLIIEDVRISCPITIGTGSGFVARRGTTFGRTVSSTGDATLSFSNCRFSTGALASIDHNSTGFCNIATTSFFSTNDPVIDGSGSGAIELSGVDFQGNSNLAGTLTVVGGRTSTGQLQLNGGSATEFIGTAVLAAGTVTIANTNIVANDRIFVTYIGTSLANTGALSTSITASTSFTIESTNVADANTVAYFIVREI